MNFLQSKNQAEIANNDGLARLNISRMLTEVRSAGKIQIQINRILQEDRR